MTILIAAAAAAMLCTGAGSVQKGAERAGPTGAERVARVNADTDGLRGTATFEDGERPAITGPTRLLGAKTIALRPTGGDRDTLVAEGARRGRVAVEYNRLSRLLVVTAPAGRWVADCRPATR